MIYVTGDTHGSYKRLRAFFRNMPVTKSDVLIILGDTGLNYFADERDLPHQKSASRLPLTLLCLRGNHDRRVEGMACYRHETSFGGNVYFEDAYPDILFASEGGIYEMEGKSALLVGGAYSVDKEWRLSHGHNWFADEQISDACKEEIETKLQARDWRIDTVLTHTCPLRFEPVEALFQSIDQNKVDKNMEIWLERIERKLSFRQWFCGHFHIDKKDGPLRFLFRDVVAL